MFESSINMLLCQVRYKHNKVIIHALVIYFTASKKMLGPHIEIYDPCAKTAYDIILDIVIQHIRQEVTRNS